MSKWSKYRKCEYCGEVFKIKSTSPQQKYCSVKCRGFSQRKEIYVIETRCACGCGQTFLNPDDHHRYRKFIRGHTNTNGTHPRIGFKESEEHLIKRISSMYKRFRNNKPTCIEKELYKFLEQNNIAFEKQKQIGRTIVDAFIPDKNLCIYADGVYWHSKPEVKERDFKINRQLQDLGYNIIRLPSIDNGYHLNLVPLQEIIK